MSTSYYLTALALAALIAPVHSFYSYANDFVDPALIITGKFPNTTLLAQRTILQWADESAALGPWSVMNKSVVPPSGSKHDYMSWGPYWWPDCSKVGNTTQLTPEQIWTTCPYVNRDGQFNPDVRTSGLNDIGNFGDMSDAILYNSLAWAITNQTSRYAANVAHWINVWFVDPDTKMNPNLDFSQMTRGPNGQNGTHTGVLDLKSMAKVITGVLILREGKAPEWTTSGADAGFVDWAKSYLPWLTTAKLAIDERESLNNHGSFYFNQLAALQILVGDTDGAKATIQDYFTGIYMGQIDANGEQPFESVRTRPYHYRAYNLAAMITNARLGAYVNYTAWNLTTTKGGTIQDACRLAMSKSPGDEDPTELWNNINAIGAIYGDPTVPHSASSGATSTASSSPQTGGGFFASYLLAKAGETYPADASFLWNQPFSDSGIVAKVLSSGGNSTSTTKPHGASGGGAGSGSPSHATSWRMKGTVGYAGVPALALVLLVGFL